MIYDPAADRETLPPAPPAPLMPSDPDAKCGWCGHLAADHTGPSPRTRLCRVEVVVDTYNPASPVAVRECGCTILGDGT